MGLPGHDGPRPELLNFNHIGIPIRIYNPDIS